MINTIKSRIVRFLDEGILYIFGSAFLAQLGGLISSIFVIQKLAKSSYGEYVAANNTYSYFAIFVGMGLQTAVLQFCSENISNKEKTAIYKYSLRKGELFNLIIMTGIGIAAVIQCRHANINVGRYLFFLCLYPIINYLVGYAQMVFRTRRQNREFALSNIVYTISLMVCNVWFTRWIGVAGLIMALYVSSIVSIAYCLLCKKNRCFINSLRKSDYKLGVKKKEIDKYAITCAITNFAYNILLLIDVTFLDIIIGKSETLADYKVAANIPSAAVFVSSCLITFFYPQIIERMDGKSRDVKHYLVKLSILFLTINGIIFIVLEISAVSLIQLVYGDKYINVIPIFRLLSFNFWLSAGVRKLFGNLIAITKKVYINLLHNIIAGVLNIVLDIVLITRWNSMGAAIATTICTLFMSFLEISYMYCYFKRTE